MRKTARYRMTSLKGVRKMLFPIRDINRTLGNCQSYAMGMANRFQILQCKRKSSRGVARQVSHTNHDSAISTMYRSSTHFVCWREFRCAHQGKADVFKPCCHNISRRQRFLLPKTVQRKLCATERPSDFQNITSWGLNDKVFTSKTISPKRCWPMRTSLS